MNPNEMLSRLEGGLVVSCQPVSGGPFDSTAAVVAFARAAVASGARGLRIEGAANVAAVVRACGVPVIGLVKRELPGLGVRITPWLEDVDALVRAGAAIIAVDATLRARPVATAVLLARIHSAGRVAMADCAAATDGTAAVAAGADCVGSTLAGYTGGAVPFDPDIGLVQALARLGVPVLAEGRFNTPALAAQAIRAGAHAVVVGSAITRPEHVTTWFHDAVAAAGRAEPVLAFDVGGTKTLAALVRGPEVLERVVVPTVRDVGAPGWVEGLAALADRWAGRYGRVAAAVTGVVRGGGWSALNPDVLPVPPGFPLEERLAAALGAGVMAINDAQAAAWGEYRFGAARGSGTAAFITVSSGIGGGLVTGGRLVTGHNGMAGSLGQVRSGGAALEARASGFAMAQAAYRAGHATDARGVFAAAQEGAAWADAILGQAAGALADGLATLQAVLDPDQVVLGGGVGLAPGFIARVRASLDCHPAEHRPRLVPAELGTDAGVIGAADRAACDRTLPWPPSRPA